MKKIIDYIVTHYLDLSADWAVFNVVTAPFLLHLDVDTYKNIYIIWLVLQVLFFVFTLIKIHKSKD